MATPVITSDNCTNSGNDTATSSWGISRPAHEIGDLIIYHLVWDDSTNVTGVSKPTGPNGETVVELVEALTDAGTNQRVSVWYYIATAAASPGTYTVTPTGSEQWTATVLRLDNSQFDLATPTGESATNTSTVDTTTVSTGSFTAGSGDDGGRLVAWLGVDTDPIIGTPAGWTDVASIDRGAVSGTLSVRNVPVAISESIPSYDWTIASDSYSAFVYIIRKNLSGTFIKAWDGSAWVEGELKIWNGSVWAPAELQRWDGVEWVEV